MQPVSDEHEMMWEDILESEIESDHRLRHPRRMPSMAVQESAYRLEDIRSWVDCLVCEPATNFELACRFVR
jgi:Ras GTPase-activating-like protein IQGAP2/3